MTSAARTIAIAIVSILLTHVGGMALDPMAVHAPPEEPALHAAAHHAGHGAVPADGLATLESALSCVDIDGVSPPPRMPDPATALVAVMPVITLPVLSGEVEAPRHWVPPSLDAAELRAFLQVFLN